MFANNYNFSSQIKFVITLVKSDNKANIIYWSLIKCKKITRSILALELYAIVYRFDIEAVLKLTIEYVLDQFMPMILWMNLKLLYNCLVKLGII